jgi:hypothetical protein
MSLQEGAEYSVELSFRVNNLVSGLKYLQVLITTAVEKSITIAQSAKYGTRESSPPRRLTVLLGLGT